MKDKAWGGNSVGMEPRYITTGQAQRAEDLLRPRMEHLRGSWMVRLAVVRPSGHDWLSAKLQQTGRAWRVEVLPLQAKQKDINAFTHFFRCKTRSNHREF